MLGVFKSCLWHIQVWRVGYRIFKNHTLHETWVQVLALPLIPCVTLGKSLNSEPQFWHL